MIQPRTCLRPHEFDDASPHGNEDLRLTAGDQYAIHLAAEKFRMPRTVRWSEAAMMALCGLCLVGMGWIFSGGW